MIKLQHLVKYGVGIKTTTYFKLMYIGYECDNRGKLCMAVFGMN